MDTAEFAKRVAITVGIATIPFLLWYFRLVLLVAVGALLLAILLDIVSKPLRWCGIPRAASIGLTLIAVFALVGAAAYMFGTTLSGEMVDVIERADIAAKGIGTALQHSTWGAALLKHIDTGQLSLTSWAGSIVSVSANVLASLVVMIAMGAYIAAQPAVYRLELRNVVPRRSRRTVEATIQHIVQSLELWSVGQAVQMLIVSMLTTFAAWLIGLPSPLALGVIAGLAEFIPYLGPFIAAAPALLVATAQGGSPLVWTILAYIAIQQIEGNVLLPIIQRRLVAIPPAIMLFGILAVGSFFGLPGVVFAAPISVMIYAVFEGTAPDEQREGKPTTHNGGSRLIDAIPDGN